MEETGETSTPRRRIESMVTRAGILFLTAMVGAAALLGGLPVGPILLLAVTVSSLLVMALREVSGNHRRFRTDRENEPPRRFRGDCRDLMGHEEPPVRRDDATR
jgi:hypothetical protein